jgi:hypothetical protein
MPERKPDRRTEWALTCKPTCFVPRGGGRRLRTRNPLVHTGDRLEAAPATVSRSHALICRRLIVFCTNAVLDRAPASLACCSSRVTMTASGPGNTVAVGGVHLGDQTALIGPLDSVVAALIASQSPT